MVTNNQNSAGAGGLRSSGGVEEMTTATMDAAKRPHEHVVTAA